MSCFDQIPDHATPFYVSDTFSIALPDPTVWHYPGPWNTAIAYQPNNLINIYLISADLAVTPLDLYGASNPGSGINTDVLVGLYDVSVPGVATYAGVIATFGPKFGAATGNLIQQASKFNVSPSANRYWGYTSPLWLQAMTPNDPGKSYQLGAVFKFNNGLSPCHAHYQYSIFGTSVIG